MTRFGSDILQSEFPEDDGSADPALTDQLRLCAASNDAAAVAQLVVLLQSARFLVPVLATADSTEHSLQGAVEKDSHMSSVTFVAADGRIGLPVFTGTATLQEWDPAARPVPRRAVDVCRQALADDLDAVLIDMASPHRFAVQGAMLKLLGQYGHA